MMKFRHRRIRQRPSQSDRAQSRFYRYRLKADERYHGWRQRDLNPSLVDRKPPRGKPTVPAQYPSPALGRSAASSKDEGHGRRGNRTPKPGSRARPRHQPQKLRPCLSPLNGAVFVPTRENPHQELAQARTPCGECACGALILLRPAPALDTGCVPVFALRGISPVSEGSSANMVSRGSASALVDNLTGSRSPA